MRSAFLYILTLFVSLAFTPAFGGDITGKDCKEALSPIFAINKDEKVLSAMQKGNPFGASQAQLADTDQFMAHLRDVPFTQYRTDRDEHSKDVNDYFGRVRKALSDCHQKCEGLGLNLSLMTAIARQNEAKKEVIDDLEKRKGDESLRPRISCANIESSFSLEDLDTIKVVLDDDEKTSLVAKKPNTAPKKDEAVDKKEEPPKKVVQKNVVEQPTDELDESQWGGNNRVSHW